MDINEFNYRDWQEDKFKFLENECAFLRKELKATKIMFDDLMGRKYASSTEAYQEEEEAKEEA